jgi:sortase A
LPRYISDDDGYTPPADSGARFLARDEEPHDEQPVSPDPNEPEEIQPSELGIAQESNPQPETQAAGEIVQSQDVPESQPPAPELTQPQSEWQRDFQPQPEPSEPQYQPGPAYSPAQDSIFAGLAQVPVAEPEHEGALGTLYGAFTEDEETGETQAVPVQPKQAKEKLGFGGWMREILGLIGELLVTVGMFLLLFVAYELWWTDLEGNAEQADVVQQMTQDFDDPNYVMPKAKNIGDKYGLIYVPRFGKNWVKPIYEGVSLDILRKGPGHYSGGKWDDMDIADMGEVGNFAVAGHRTTWGAPFNKIATLKNGDYVIVTNGEKWFIYQIYDHTVVTPDQVQVVAPVPNHPRETATEAVMTMTSCHPEFSSRERYVQWAKLVDTSDYKQGVKAEYLEVAE